MLICTQEEFKFVLCDWGVWNFLKPEFLLFISIFECDDLLCVPLFNSVDVGTFSKWFNLSHHVLITIPDTQEGTTNTQICNTFRKVFRFDPFAQIGPSQDYLLELFQLNFFDLLNGMSFGFNLARDLWPLITTMSILTSFLLIIRRVITVVWTINLDHLSRFAAALILLLITSFLVSAPLWAIIIWITCTTVAIWTLWVFAALPVIAITLTTSIVIRPGLRHLARFLSITIVAFGSFFRCLFGPFCSLLRRHFFLYLCSLLFYVADFFITNRCFSMSIVKYNFFF